MNWNESVASRCRYGDVAERIWKDWEIVWEDSQDDYQGHATILAKKGDRYSFYEWWYGSCSGCDAWESDGKGDDAIEAEMRDSAMWFDDKEQLKRWLDMLDSNPRGGYDPKVNVMGAGLDWLSGGTLGRINAVRKELGMPEYQPKGDEDGTD
jgi:hypothetical protein